MKKIVNLMAALFASAMLSAQSAPDFNILGLKLGMSEEKALEALYNYGFDKKEASYKDAEGRTDILPQKDINGTLSQNTLFAGRNVSDIKLTFMSESLQGITISIPKCNTESKKRILDNLASKYNLLVLSKGVSNDYRSCEMGTFVNHAVVDMELHDDNNVTYLEVKDLSQLRRIEYFMDDNTDTKNTLSVNFKKMN